MHKILYSTIIILFLTHTFCFTQKPHPCGTKSKKSDWLTQYQQQPQTFSKGGDTMLYLPMTVHTLGQDDGSGHFSITRVLDAFCTLNNDFAEANIQFYMADDVDRIDNSAFNRHDTIRTGGLFMRQYDVPNTVNSYIMDDPAGNCGYNLPWASLTVNEGCASPNDHTWAHEVGHNFSLQHPFYGWQGGVSHDNSVPHNYADPAPEYVLSDYTIFKDTLWTDTLIVDTILVEKMDGSNCHIAADGFCDTKPDYLNYRWQCTNDNQSSVTQTDPNGEKFISNGELIMSYSFSECKVGWSPEQIGAMRAHVLDQRKNLFSNPRSVEPPVTEVADLIYPLADEVVPANNIELNWEPVPNATRYVVQVSFVPNSFPGRPGNYETDQPNFIVPDSDPNIQIGRKYYWRVRAYNHFNTCSDYSDTETFVVGDISAVAKINGLNEFKIYPSNLVAGETFKMSLNTSISLLGNLQITDLTGRILLLQNVNAAIGTTLLELPSDGLAPGMYLIGLQTEEGNAFEKVLVR